MAQCNPRIAASKAATVHSAVAYGNRPQFSAPKPMCDNPHKTAFLMRSFCLFFLGSFGLVLTAVAAWAAQAPSSLAPKLPPGLRLEREGNVYRLVVAKAGRYQFKQEFIAKVARAEPWNQISFKGPAAAIASMFFGVLSAGRATSNPKTARSNRLSLGPAARPSPCRSISANS